MWLAIGSDHALFLLILFSAGLLECKTENRKHMSRLMEGLHGRPHIVGARVFLPLHKSVVCGQGVGYILSDGGGGGGRVN